ncbi:MAG: hypothetical protein Q8L86_03740 [Vicinamibacterales bacterium]|nr:hypothetical protein [Vicinamibacterales bacterium]
MEWTSWVMGGLVMLCLVQASMLFRVFRVIGAAERTEERLSHYSGALALLTETTESGFRAMALELGRLGHPAATGSARVTTARVARQARRGRTITEIASSEDVSEGEVRLRMHLAEQGGRKKENVNGAMRAY